MAGITELRELVKDNHEASEIVSSIERTMMQNTGRIKDLETDSQKSINDMNEAIASRDKIKTVIKDELGIEEFTVEAVRGKLENYASDDAIAARDNQFNELKARSGTKIESLEAQLMGNNKTINDMKLKLAIAGTDIMSQTKGEYANAMLMGWIAEDAVFDEEGAIQYKGSSGETLYNENGNPLTLDDRINSIKGDESRDFVFQSRFLAGNGAPTERIISGPSGSVSGGSYVRTTMSEADRTNYIDKFGMDSYLKLPMV